MTLLSHLRRYRRWLSTDEPPATWRELLTLAWLLRPARRLARLSRGRRRPGRPRKSPASPK